jgi:hypothetical protein
MVAGFASHARNGRAVVVNHNDGERGVKKSQKWISLQSFACQTANAFSQNFFDRTK